MIMDDVLLLEFLYLRDNSFTCSSFRTIYKYNIKNFSAVFVEILLCIARIHFMLILCGWDGELVERYSGSFLSNHKLFNTFKPPVI